MIDVHHHLTLRVGAIVVLVAIVCSGTTAIADNSSETASTLEAVYSSTTQLPSSNTAAFATSPNEGNETILDAAATQTVFVSDTTSASKTLGSTATVLNSAQPLSSDVAHTGADSSNLPTSSIFITSVSTVSLAESATSSVKIASSTLAESVPTTASESGSPDTSTAIMATTTISAGFTFITSSPRDAASETSVHSNSAPKTSTADILTIGTGLTTGETSIRNTPASTSAIIGSDMFTSQSSLTAIPITSAVNSTMNSSDTVSHSGLYTTTNEMSTVLSSKSSRSLDISSTEAPLTTQSGNTLSYSGTVELVAISTNAMSISSNVYSTFNSNANDKVFTNDTASSGINGTSTMSMDLSSTGVMNKSEVMATTVDSASSKELSLTTTNSRTISPMTAIHAETDNAASSTFASTVGVISTQTVSTATISQRSASNTYVTDETRLAINDTVTPASLTNKSTLQSSPSTEGASVFPNATLILSSTSRGPNIDDTATPSVKMSTTSEVPAQSVGYDTTRSDGGATSAAPAFTAEKGTISTSISETVTRLSSATFSTWSSSMSSADATTASYFYSTASSALLISESSASSHASVPSSSADNETHSSSASTELSTALTGTTSMLTSIPTEHTSSSYPPVFSSVTAPKDSSTQTVAGTYSSVLTTTQQNSSSDVAVTTTAITVSVSALTYTTANVLVNVSTQPSVKVGNFSTNADQLTSTSSAIATASPSSVFGNNDSISSLPDSTVRLWSDNLSTAHTSDPNQTTTAVSTGTVAGASTTTPQNSSSDVAVTIAAKTVSMSVVTSTTANVLVNVSTQLSVNASNVSTIAEQLTSTSPTITEAPPSKSTSSAVTAASPSSAFGNNSNISSLPDSTERLASANLSTAHTTSPNQTTIAVTSGTVAGAYSSAASITQQNSSSDVAVTTAAITVSMSVMFTTANSHENISSQPSVKVSNVSAGNEQLTSKSSTISEASPSRSTSSAVTAASPSAAFSNNSNISSLPDSTDRFASANLSTADTTSPNQTTIAVTSGTVAEAYSSAASITQQNSSSDVAVTTAATTVSLSAATSAAANVIANASSAMSTGFTYFPSIPTISTASQSVNSTEASHSMTSSLVTTTFHSYNATESSSASFVDRTSTTPIRPNFTVEAAERKYGAVVQMTTNLSIAKFESLRSNLQQELTNLTNSKCNSAPLFPTCCRQSGSRLTNDSWKVFVNTKEVYIGQAQNPLSGQVWFVVAVAPEANNSLCTSGGSESGRNVSRPKRDVNLLVENILDPAFLTLILSNATSEIERIMGDLTNTTVVVNLIARAEVVASQLETTAGTAATTTTTRTSVVVESSPNLISWVLPVTFILAAAILVITVIVACRRKRRGFARMVDSRAHKDGAYSYELHMSP